MVQCHTYKFGLLSEIVRIAISVSETIIFPSFPLTLPYSLSHTHLSPSPSPHLSPSGAIAIGGGQFSNETVSILAGSVECNGTESGLLECSHVTGSDEAVTQCDPRESAAVTCQGKHLMLYAINSHI